MIKQKACNNKYFNFLITKNIEIAFTIRSYEYIQWRIQGGARGGGRPPLSPDGGPIFYFYF